MEGNKGFTLLEVMVAAVILSLAYVAVLQNFSLSMSNLFKIDRQMTEYFENLLDFEDQLYAAYGIEDEELEGEVFWEGRIYGIYLVTSENGKFASFVLKKKL